MSQYDHLLDKLCQYPETFQKARALLREAVIKTAPGTGFDLGPFRPGLPAICAYIASQRLQNNDVSRPAAQESSCLKKSDFEKTYFIIDNALVDTKRSRRRPTDGPVRSTYEQLIKKYELPIGPSRLLPCYMKAEKAVLVHPDYDPSFKDSDIKILVFWYVCKIVKGSEMWPKDEYSHQNRLSARIFNELLPLIRKAVSPLKKDIRESIRRSRPRHIQEYIQKHSIDEEDEEEEEEQSPPRPKRNFPSPSKSSRTRQLPSRSPQKGVLPLNDDKEEHGNPSSTTPPPAKRRRHDPSLSLGAAPPTPPDSASGTPVNSRSDPFSLISNDPMPTLPPNNNCALSSHITFPRDTTLSASQSKRISDSSYFPPLPVRRGRRYRPTLVDHAQWCNCDPKLVILRKVGEDHKEEMTKLYGHPLQNPMSDVESSGSQEA